MTYYDEVAADAPDYWWKNWNNGEASSGSNTATLTVSGITQGTSAPKGVLPTPYGEFDGDDRATASLTAMGTVWSVETWVNTSVSGKGTHRIIEWSNPLVTVYTAGYYPNSSAQIGKPGMHINGSEVYANTRVDDGQWHHVVFVVNGWSAEIYIDGVLDKTGSITQTSVGAKTVAIGSSVTEDPADYFVGKMDELAIYKKALSASRILAHYNAANVANVTVDVSTATQSTQIINPSFVGDPSTAVDAVSAVTSVYANPISIEAYGTNAVVTTVNPTFDTTINPAGSSTGTDDNRATIEVSESAAGSKRAKFTFSKSALLGAEPVVLLSALLRLKVQAISSPAQGDIRVFVDGYPDTIKTFNYSLTPVGNIAEFDVTALVETTVGDTITVILDSPDADPGSAAVEFHSVNATSTSDRPTLTAVHEPAQLAEIVDVATATATTKTIEPTVEAGFSVEVLVDSPQVLTQTTNPAIEINDPLPALIDLDTPSVSAQANDASFAEYRTATLYPTSDSHRNPVTNTWVNNPDYMELNYTAGSNASTVIQPVGTTTQVNMINEALRRMDYPLESLASAINSKYGTSYVTVQFYELGATEGGNVLGQFISSTGEIYLDPSIEVSQAAVTETLAHEIAHLVDEVAMTNAQRLAIWNAYHPSSPLPGGTIISRTGHVADGEGWLYGDYTARVGEAFAHAFVVAYSTSVIDPNAYSHTNTPVIYEAIRHNLTPSQSTFIGPFPVRTPVARMVFGQLPAGLVAGAVESATLRLNVEQNTGSNSFAIRSLHQYPVGKFIEPSGSVTKSLSIGLNNLDVAAVFDSKNFLAFELTNGQTTSNSYARISSIDEGDTNTMPVLVVRYLVNQDATVVDLDTPSTNAVAHDVTVEAVVSPDMIWDADTPTLFASGVEAIVGIPVSVLVDTATLTADTHEPEVDIRINVIFEVDVPRITAKVIGLTDVNGEPIVPSETEDEYFNTTMRTLSGYNTGFSGGLGGAGGAIDPSIQYWFRLNEKTGNVALDRAYSLRDDGVTKDGQGTLTLNGVVPGRNDGPDGRHSFYFNGDAYLHQNDSGFGTDEIYYEPSSLEFTFRTDRKTQFLMGGSDQKYDLNIDNNPPWELWMVDGKLQMRQYDWNLQLLKTSQVTNGTTDLADGQWHHVVIQNSHEGTLNPALQSAYFATEIFVDANLEVRRRTGVAPQGFPDRIGGRPDRYYSGAQWAVQAPELAKSHWFLGDMTELVYRNGRTLNEDEIAYQRDAMFGITPYRPEPARVFFDANADVVAKGNKPRVLILHITPTRSRDERNSKWTVPNRAYEVYNGAFGEETSKASMADAMRFGGREMGDWIGYGEAGPNLPSLNTGETLWFHHYATGNHLVDPVTDNYRLIDLETDLNMDDFDMISVVGYPRNEHDWSLFDTLDSQNRPPMVPARVQLERLVAQVRDQVVNHRKSLYVNDPNLAVALDIVSKVEYVPNVIDHLYLDRRLGANVGYADWRSAEVDPFNGANPEVPIPLRTGPSEAKASRYVDTHANIKHQVRALVPGLTDRPSWIFNRALFWNNINPFGTPPYHISRGYDQRPFGLEVGDEFFMDGSYWTDEEETTLFWMRAHGWLATPVDNILAGTAVTTFSPLIHNGKEFKGNPYYDHATTIAIQPGDLWAGEQVTGKVYVNFTEGFTQNPGAQRHDEIMRLRSRGWEDGLGVGDVIQKSNFEFTITPEMLKYQFSTHFGNYQYTDYVSSDGSKPDWGWGPGGSREGSSGSSGGSAGFRNSRFISVVPMEDIYVPTMSNRGILWLLSDLDVSGTANVNTVTARASTNAGEVEVEAQKTAHVDLSTARVQVEAHNDADTIDPDASVMVGTGRITYRAITTVTEITLSTAQISLQSSEPEEEPIHIEWDEALVMVMPRQQIRLTLEDALR